MTGITHSKSIDSSNMSSPFGLPHFSGIKTKSYTDKELRKMRKRELMTEFTKDPKLFSEIIVELRKKKIKKLRND